MITKHASRLCYPLRTALDVCIITNVLCSYLVGPISFSSSVWVHLDFVQASAHEMRLLLDTLNHCLCCRCFCTLCSVHCISFASAFASPYLRYFVLTCLCLSDSVAFWNTESHTFSGLTSSSINLNKHVLA